MNFRTRLLIVLSAFLINALILFSLPLIKFLGEGGLGDTNLGASQELKVTTVNIEEKKKKVRKIKLETSRPKLTNRAQANNSRFNLDFGIGAYGEGASLSSADSANLIYDENSVDNDPVRISGRDPKVPDSFAATSSEGRVELEIIIEANGRVSQVEVILEDPPNYQLGRSAASAIRTWRYRPATIKNIPVRIRVIVPFVFI